MEKHVVLSGWLKPLVVTEYYEKGIYDDDYNMVDSYEEEIDITVLGFYSGDDAEPLAEKLHRILYSIESQCKEFKVNASVVYHLADVEKTWEEFTTNALNMLEGEANVEWRHRFSSLTGYLWTDQKFIVNQHDVLAEIGHQITGQDLWEVYIDKMKPKFLMLEIFFSGEDR